MMSPREVGLTVQGYAYIGGVGFILSFTRWSEVTKIVAILVIVTIGGVASLIAASVRRRQLFRRRSS
jgi:hypothetical protein